MRTSFLPLLALLFACSDDKPANETADSATTTTTTTTATTTTGTTGPASGQAFVRAAHVVIGVGDVNVTPTGSKDALFSDVGFLMSSAYTEVPSGSYDLDISDAKGATFSVSGVELADGGTYTVYAYGTADDPRTILIDDAQDGLPKANGRINMVHGAYDVGEVDIWNVTDPKNPVEVAADLSYGDQQSIDMEEGSVLLGIDTDNDGVPELTYGAGVLRDMVFDTVAFSEGFPTVAIAALFPDGTVVRLDAE
jgi:hypothetical protein